MRVIRLVPIIIAALLILSISCDKGNNSDVTRLRITKISDNQAMENPITFEYNSKGLLVKMHYTYDRFYWSVEYNRSNQPIKLCGIQEDGVGGIIESNEDSINWNSKSFTVTHQFMEDVKYMYNLSPDNQLESLVIFERKDTMSTYDTVEIWKSNWIGNSQLKIVHTYYPPYEENDEWEENFSFGTGNSPLKGINIALVGYVSGWLIWDSEYQNLYPTTKFSTGNLIADVVYEFNKDSFPIKADFKYSDSNTHKYYYFEYEAY
jgi:hypothetical protein